MVLRLIYHFWYKLHNDKREECSNMATMYEIISFAGLDQKDEAKVKSIIEKSGKYQVHQKGFLGGITVDGDPKEIAEYVKAMILFGSEEECKKAKAAEE